MLRNFIHRGLLLGLNAGLLVTLFDWLFMLYSKVYVPFEYPFLLVTFNILLWSAFGVISGFTQWVFSHGNKVRQQKEEYYWLVFFLLPFSFMYGLLGKLFIPVSIKTMAVPPVVFDHSLSFAWVIIIILFLLVYYKKNFPAENPVSVCFTLEIIIFIILFYFCSSPKIIDKFSALCVRRLNFVEHILRVESDFYQQLAYLAGVLLITVFYFITLLRKTLLKKKSGEPPSQSISMKNTRMMIR